MNKQPSNPNFKSKSRQKQKLKPNPSKSKVQPQSNRASQFINNISNPSKLKQKQLKSTKKMKIDQERPQTAIAKHKYENKQQRDQYGLCMKADLKHIINRNNVVKQQNNEIVPQLLKNIEKNCKALKQIHHKQSQISEKKSNQHTNKFHKSKKISVQYKKCDQKLKMRQSLQKDMTDKQELLQNKNRFSLQLSQGEVEKTRIQHKLKQNVCRKSVENKVEQKNFVELFRLYKKSFQIQEFKIQKSTRKTNYNTNQSRNSSSHHNSHAHSRVDYNFRGKSREQEKLNIQKIQSLIKSQQKKAQIETVQADSLIYTGTVCFNKQQTVELLLKDSSKIENQLFSQSRKLDKIQDNSNYQSEVRDGMINESKVAKDMQYEGKQYKKEEKQNNKLIQKDINKQQVSDKAVEENFDQQILQKKFQKSKFYVQPIPKFEQAKKQDKEQAEDLSLIGCQITLIENNIVLEDSELASLQL